MSNNPLINTGFQPGAPAPAAPSNPERVEHPFSAGPGSGIWCDAENRLHIIANADAALLQRILALPANALQKTVRLAAERRLRKLQKQEAK